MDKKEYYINDFSDYLSINDKSPGTISTYSSNIRQFIKYFKETYGEEFNPEEVIVMDLQDYRSYLLNVKRQKAATINTKFAALKEYFSFLTNKKIIKNNPTSNLKKVKTNKPIAPKSFSDTDFKRIKRYVYRSQKDIWIAILELLAKTGVRVSELINIRLSDITINERSGNLRVFGKNRRERNIPLHVDVRKALQSYLESRDKLLIDSDYLLISERRQPYSRSGIFKMLKRWENDTNVKIHPHLFRHYFATQILKSPGSNINTVQTLLGHESLESSAVYLRVRQKDLENSINALSD